MGNKQQKVKKPSLVDSLLKKKKAKKILKVLILGSGESGKTTLIKQLRLIHQHSFNDAEQQEFKTAIYQNLVNNIKILIEAANDNEIAFGDPQNIEKLVGIMDKNENVPASTFFNADLARSIQAAWKDTAIQSVWNEHYTSLHLPDSAKYFFDEIDRISQPNYVPNESDLVRVRIRTTGISELKVANPAGGGDLVIIDVGGQQNERKYWISQFNAVNAVIFVVGASDFDKLLWEDDATNRIHDSLQLFKDISNNQAFANSGIILFLNKFDVFKEKAQKVDMSVCWEDYTGGLSAEAGIKFMENKFKSVCTKHKQIFVHYTSATDSELTAKVFENIKTTVLNKSLAANGLE